MFTPLRFERESDICMWVDLRFNGYIGELKTEAMTNGFESALRINAELRVQNALYTPTGTGSDGAIWTGPDSRSLVKFRSAKRAGMSQQILELRLEKLKLTGRCD